MDKFSLKFSCVVGRVQLAGAIWRLQLFLFKRCASVRADHDFDCRYDMSPPQSMAASGQRLNHPVQGSNFGMIGFPGISIDWDQLRQQVHGTLNRLGDFEPGAFQITERMVMVSGNPCGVHYCLHGPRNVKITAVADLKKRQILFYGTDGQRLEQISLEN